MSDLPVVLARGRAVKEIWIRHRGSANLGFMTLTTTAAPTSDFVGGSEFGSNDTNDA